MSRRKMQLQTKREKGYQELFEEYIRYCKMQKLSPDTIQTYYHHHRYFLNFTGNDLQCADIDQNLIDAYKLHLIEKGLNGVSVNSYQHNISPVIKYGIKIGVHFAYFFYQCKRGRKNTGHLHTRRIKNIAEKAQPAKPVTSQSFEIGRW